jgi:hypothetical protein
VYQFAVGANGQVIEREPVLLNAPDESLPWPDRGSSCWPIEAELTSLRLLDEGHVGPSEPVEDVRDRPVVD